MYVYIANVQYSMLSHLCCCDSCTAAVVAGAAVAVVEDCCWGALVGAVVTGVACRMILPMVTKYRQTNRQTNTRTHTHTIYILNYTTQIHSCTETLHLHTDIHNTNHITLTAD